MTMRGLLLAMELRLWRAGGHRPVLWWRDDDAREPAEALRRLLTLATETGVPITIAAIPDGDRSSLAAALAQAPGATLVQHGVDHRNRAAAGLGSGEFAADTEGAAMVAALNDGWSRLAGLPGSLKLFVPPWNAVHPALPQALVEAGYRGWSAWAETTSVGPLPRLDAHLDVLRWKGGGRFRGEGAILGKFTRLLAERRKQGLWEAPIGLLTHHLDHDAATWAFLARFLARRDLDWRGLPELLAAAR
jgi:hypothetical protein